MSTPRTYVHGEYKIACDICGFIYHFSRMRRGVSGKQKGLIVGPKCFDNIHPRDIKTRLRPKRPLPKVR
jgi:hypothetical protein